jgi:molybdenum cofactor guanylyltransferase
MQPHQNTNYDVTVVILAGGGSRRMQGQDKGMLLLRGKPLITHVIGQLAPQTEKLMLNCNDNCSAYQTFGYPLVSDSLAGGLGPLAGLLAAMEQSDTEYVLSVPCDTPYLPVDLLSRMCQSLQQSGAEVCSVSDGQRLHPVILLVSRHLANNLKDYLLSGGRRVQEWYERQSHCLADFSDQPTAFANINTPDELQAEDTP